MLFALIATFVWSNNPDLTEFTWEKLWGETKQAWADSSGNFGKRRPTAKTSRAQNAFDTNTDAETLVTEPVKAAINTPLTPDLSATPRFEPTLFSVCRCANARIATP